MDKWSPRLFTCDFPHTTPHWDHTLNMLVPQIIRIGDSQNESRLKGSHRRLSVGLIRRGKTL